MEIECLEAETKGFRDELWKVAEEESMGETGRAYSSFVRALKVVSLSLAIVLAAVIPLSIDSERQSAGFVMPSESLALLSSSENDIINALRESLSRANRGRIVLTVEIPEETRVSITESGAASASERVLPPKARIAAVSAVEVRTDEKSKAVEKYAKPAEERSPSFEEVISLIQVGQRALRVSEPAVKVLPEESAN
jgi:hypothetical protein